MMGLTSQPANRNFCGNQDPPNFAELRFKEYLDAKRYGYVYLDQSPLMFAAEFHDHRKRPDFLVNISSIGTIAVDVKDKPLNAIYKNFAIDEVEVLRLVAWQDQFRTPVWFAISSEASDYNTWYFIHLDSIREVGTKRRRKDTGEAFWTIKITNCITIGHDDSLHKLVL
ncbi:MAG: hypothetical protein RBG13Loki_2412 [Promethearchaeota archaeon CR_4]|nr:MAG: hypothetical protein RBG13Loki_2412 [Candidatus Lokiarchaeota archaeon CR_4]